VQFHLGYPEAPLADAERALSRAREMGAASLMHALSLVSFTYLYVGDYELDPKFPAPTIAVWEQSRHPWVSLPPDTPSKRVAKQG